MSLVCRQITLYLPCRNGLCAGIFLSHFFSLCSVLNLIFWGAPDNLYHIQCCSTSLVPGSAQGQNIRFLGMPLRWSYANGGFKKKKCMFAKAFDTSVEKLEIRPNKVSLRPLQKFNTILIFF